MSGTDPLTLSLSKGLAELVLPGCCDQRKHVRDTPGEVRIFIALGDRALGQGAKAQVKQHFESALKEAPRLGEDVLIKLGAIELENSNTDEAAALWRRALALNPDNSSLRTKIDQLGATAGT